MSDIKEQKVHPHPDRSFSDELSVADTRREWQAAKPRVEEKIARYSYTEAALLVPAVVNDADGELSSTLKFWHTYLRDLKEFQLGLPKAIQKLEGDDRKIKTPKGDGEIRLVDTVNFTVRIDGANQEFKWSEIGPKQILKLSRRAYKNMGTRYYIYQMAFAYAHMLEDGFWDRVLDIGSAEDGDNYKSQAETYQEAWDKREGG